jgi:vesicle-fusing ATPase
MTSRLVNNQAAPPGAIGAATAAAPRRTAAGTASVEPVLIMQVGSSPHKDLVYTNHAYFNDAKSQELLYSRRDASQPDAYVLVYVEGGPQFVFTSRPHPGVQVGSIGLSSLQRETLKVNLAAPIHVQPWLLPSDGSRDLLSLTVSVELIGTKRVTILAADLAPALKAQFVRQVFSKEQTFCMDFQGTVLKLTVTGAEAGIPAAEQDRRVQKARLSGEEVDEDEMQAVREVDRGVVRDDTRIDLTAPPSKFMTFKPLERKKDVLNAKFKFADMGIGGLDAEFTTIFRRSFVSRMYPPEVLKKLGVRHVKGMLLYGPPGTGTSAMHTHAECDYQRLHHRLSAATQTSALAACVSGAYSFFFFF